MKDWEKSLNIDNRFSWATKEQRKQILAECRFQRKDVILQAREKVKKLRAGDSLQIKNIYVSSDNTFKKTNAKWHNQALDEVLKQLTKEE